jgi:hypothetical protein
MFLPQQKQGTVENVLGHIYKKCVPRGNYKKNYVRDAHPITPLPMVPLIEQETQFKSVEKRVLTMLIDKI